MKRIVVSLVLGLLFVSVLTSLYRTQNAVSSPSQNNYLINGGFETGTLDGWNVSGVCAISSSTVYDGLYSAYISDADYDNIISQQFSSGLPVDSGISLRAAVYPTMVGSMGNVMYPTDSIVLYFNFTSSMQPAFEVAYRWVWNTPGQNMTNRVSFYVNFQPSTWNILQRDVTADVYSYFTSYNLSDVTLTSVYVWYHYSNGSPGPFYVDDLSISNVPITSPQIVSVAWTPTNPWPYVPSNTTRPNEPVLITVNITDPSSVVRNVLLCYEADTGEWWNTTMTYNSTAQLWFQTVPGQSNRTNSVQFFIQAYDGVGNLQTSPTLTYQIQHLPPCDVNGDGEVNLKDIGIVAKNFGQQIP